MVAYATRSDVYTYGLARGALGNAGRLLSSALAATDMFELDVHGFETGDTVTFRAADGGTLPAPIVDGTTYYAIRVNEARFQVSTTVGGPALGLTTDGVSVEVATPLPFDQVLEFYSRFADAFIPAHMVPLTAPYPITVVAIVAELAAAKLQRISGQTSASMQETELAAKAQLERWATGLPLRDNNAPVITNLAVTGVAMSSSTGTDARGWGSGTLP